MDAHSSQSPAQRSRFRGSLTQLGSLLAMTLVIVGVFAMFSVWSLNRAHVESNRQAAEFLYALDDGRSAQTLFKIQVQEWKNILLRGEDKTNFSQYLASFQAKEVLVQERLNSLATRADQLNLPEVTLSAKALAEEHRRLGNAYRTALAEGRSTRWDPHAIDRSVRGIDRKLDTELDQLADSLIEETDKRRAEASRQESDRYRALRGFMGWTIAISIALVGLVLWTALRKDSSPA